MRKAFLRSLMLASVLAAPSASPAQEPASAPSPDGAPEARPSAAPSPAPAPQQGRTVDPRNTNVRVELTLTDRSGAAPPAVKSATLTIADSARASLRSSSEIMAGSATDSPRVLPLDVDLRVKGWSGGQSGTIALELTVDYRSIDRSDKESKFYPTAGLRFSGNVVLPNGKSMLVAQATDPVSDRRITLEVKAAILR